MSFLHFRYQIMRSYLVLRKNARKAYAEQHHFTCEPTHADTKKEHFEFDRSIENGKEPETLSAAFFLVVLVWTNKIDFRIPKF